MFLLDSYVCLTLHYVLSYFLLILFASSYLYLFTYCPSLPLLMNFCLHSSSLSYMYLSPILFLLFLLFLLSFFLSYSLVLFSRVFHFSFFFCLSPSSLLRRTKKKAAIYDYWEVFCGVVLLKVRLWTAILWRGIIFTITFFLIMCACMCVCLLVNVMLCFRSMVLWLLMTARIIGTVVIIITTIIIPIVTL